MYKILKFYNKNLVDISMDQNLKIIGTLAIEHFDTAVKSTVPA